MPDRREFLTAAAALPFVARGLCAAPLAADPPADVVSFSGLILRQQEPRLRLDMLFATLEATLRYLVTLGVSDLFHCLAASGRKDAEAVIECIMRRSRSVVKRRVAVLRFQG